MLKAEVYKWVEGGCCQYGATEEHESDDHAGATERPCKGIEVDGLTFFDGKPRKKDRRDEHEHRGPFQEKSDTCGAFLRCGGDGEHVTKKRPCLGKSVSPEEDPTDSNQEHRKGIPQKPLTLKAEVAFQESFNDQEDAVIDAPYNKGPRRSVPQPAQEEHNPKVKTCSCAPVSVTPERDVHEISEPSREAHMPPAPEFGDGRGSVGLVEVLGEVESEHSGEANRHIRIS